MGLWFLAQGSGMHSQSRWKIQVVWGRCQPYTLKVEGLAACTNGLLSNGVGVVSANHGGCCRVQGL